MPLSWFKVKLMFYVDNYSLVTLGNTTELNDLLCWFSSERYLQKNFLLKLQIVLYQLQFYQRWTPSAGFLKFLTKSVDKHFIDGYFYLLLSLKLFSRKKSFTEIWSIQRNLLSCWWTLIIKGRCNVVPLYCSLILRSSQGFTLSNGVIIGKDRLQVNQ